MTLLRFETMYLDWVNNFLTIEAFASHYDISVKDASWLINAGNEIGQFTPISQSL